MRLLFISYLYLAAAKSLQSCPTLCDPIDGSPPGFPIIGILQARTLEWVAISFSNAWKWKVKVKLLSRVWLLVTPWTAAYQAALSMGFVRQEYWSRVPLPSPYLCLSKNYLSFLLQQVSPSLSLSYTHTHTHTHTHTLVWLMCGSQLGYQLFWPPPSPPESTWDIPCVFILSGQEGQSQNAKYTGWPWPEKEAEVALELLQLQNMSAGS